ncbi:YegP family protein [Arthrobacter sp. MMS24-S77]
MAGMFELYVDTKARYRFRLKAPDGTVMAVSKGFDDKPAAVAGIRDVRAWAGMGLISDLCPSQSSTSGPTTEDGSPAPPEAAPQRSGPGLEEPSFPDNGATQPNRPRDE